MKKLILIIIAAVLISSCTKEELRSACEINHFGTLKLCNLTDDMYNFYVDDKFITAVNPGSYYYKNRVASGYHTCRMEQANGYILYPNIYTGDFILSDCDTKPVTIY